MKLNTERLKEGKRAKDKCERERFDLLGSLFSFPPSIMIKKLHESRNEQNGDFTKFTKYKF